MKHYIFTLLTFVLFSSCSKEEPEKENLNDSLFVEISDSEFEKFLIAEKIDDILDGKVLRDSVLKVRTLEIFSSDYNQPLMIKDLSGIEEFKNLEELEVGNTEIQKINTTHYAKLRKLTVRGNRSLRELDLSGNRLLTDLSISGNNILVLDLSALSNMTMLNIGEFELVELKGVNSPFLKWVSIYQGKFLQLSLVNSPNIERLTFANNSQLRSLDISTNNQLSHLVVDGGSENLEEIRLPLSDKMTYIAIWNTKLSKFDATKFKNLERLILSNCRLEEIDLRTSRTLTSVDLFRNNLRSLDVSQNLDLTALDVRKNPVATICIPESLNEIPRNWHLPYENEFLVARKCN